MLGFSVLGLAFASAVLIVASVIFFLIAIYFAYARYRFSPAGGDLQSRIQDLVLENLDWDGRGQAIDIGCGNAPLAIRLAQRFPGSTITGIDYWGGMWEYAKVVCEKNAEISGVASQVTFQKATASHLAFADESFDATISNLVFHEVKDARDKREVIREALRVLKKGGRFSFQDLFQLKSYYGEIDHLLAQIEGWGIAKVRYIKTSDAEFIPALLKLPFMVGAIGVIHGEK